MSIRNEKSSFGSADEASRCIRNDDTWRLGQWVSSEYVRNNNSAVSVSSYYCVVRGKSYASSTQPRYVQEKQKNCRSRGDYSFPGSLGPNFHSIVVGQRSSTMTTVLSLAIHKTNGPQGSRAEWPKSHPKGHNTVLQSD